MGNNDNQGDTMNTSDYARTAMARIAAMPKPKHVPVAWPSLTPLAFRLRQVLAHYRRAA